MNGEFSLLNRQRTRKVEARKLRRIIARFLDELPDGRACELSIVLVASREMTRVNETHLRHSGSTDVITFDYSENKSATLAGEILVCVDEAVLQARRFNTKWKEELVRYIVHGVLHLLGHDDKKPPARRLMKRQENLWVQKLGARF